MRRIARSLPIGAGGSCEVLIRLRAIAAHLAGTAANEQERRALARALLSLGRVSHMTQMNHAQAHGASVSAATTDHGIEARAVWMRQDAAQSVVNAVYMSLLSRLSKHGVPSRDEVWRAMTDPPRRRCLPNRARQRCGLLDLVAKSPLTDIQWREENLARRANAQ